MDDPSGVHAERQKRHGRQRAWQEQYAGLHDKDRAFMLAGLLDTLALQLDRVDAAVRRDAVFACCWLLGERGT